MTKRKACVLGWPARHSRSPLIHGYWLRQFGIDGEYDSLEVPPIDFPNFLGTLAANGFVGANVTLPHKEVAFDLLDVAEPSAMRLRAANTLWYESGRLHGANTDSLGFLANLDEHAPGWEARTATATVLGAGGAARAVVQGFVDRGVARIHVVNRSRTHAEELCALFGPMVQAHAWQQLPELLAETDLLCNATSLGMTGKQELTIDLSTLRPQALVTDLVYVPLVTQLLAHAKELGHPVVDGLGMLLHQAVPGFEKWFGVRPEVTPELRALVIEDLARGS